MPILWDDLELLALMYALHEAGGLHYRSGDQLLQEMGGSAGVDSDRAAFVRTLHVMAQDELIAFELLVHGLVSTPRPESYEYLAHLRNFVIRTKGLDRARGIKIVDPPPEPGEDDGRSIPGLIIKDIEFCVETPREVPDGEIRQEMNPPERSGRRAIIQTNDQLDYLARLLCCQKILSHSHIWRCDPDHFRCRNHLAEGVQHKIT